MTKLSAEDEADLRDTARQRVGAGYENAEEIEQCLIDLADDFDPPLSARDLRRIVRQVLIDAIEAQRRNQSGWPALTDYDRMRLAFDKLEDEGIIAREDFTCCGTCGAAEIGGEIEDFEANGRSAKGFVFFHNQDTDRAVDGAGLCFNYGAFIEPHEERSVEIGRKLFDTLVSVGLSPAWDGTLAKRIQLPMAWQRPWTGAVPSPIKRWMF